MIEIKKLVVDGKALQLKVINQLSNLTYLYGKMDIECLGYYNIKNSKKYIFKLDDRLYSYTDFGWSISKAFKKQLCGTGNRFKSFDSDEKRDVYFNHIELIQSKLVQDQLFY